MPDWSYQPFLKPLLFSLAPGKASQVTLASMARLAGIPGGSQLIDFMGHMSPPKSIAAELCGKDVPSRVGLGAGIDIDGTALSALERFGFGFIELGPVSFNEYEIPEQSRSRDIGMSALISSDPSASCSLDLIVSRLSKYQSRKRDRAVGIAVRVGHSPDSDPKKAALEIISAICTLNDLADWIVLDTRWLTGNHDATAWISYLDAIKTQLDANESSMPLLVALPPGIECETMISLISDAQASIKISGVTIAGGMLYGEDETSPRRLYGAPTFAPSLECVRSIRRHFSPDLLVIGSGGIIEPADALEFIDSGADFVQLNSGLVFSGPGLPKRINEALESRDYERSDSSQIKQNLLTQGWFYSFLLGIGMLIGGILAWILGMTRVVLPYDEKFLDLTRAGIVAINPNLLHFMMHDRVTLAATMMSIGIIYIGLSAFGIRRGEHWAWKALIVSASIGFASFFLYLGFGYFDPLHAAVSALLLPIFLAGAFLGPSKRQPIPPLSLRNDPAWRSGMLGQLILVLVGVGLFLAAVTISLVGITHVFVPQDLEFLRTTPNVIRAANPHLLPLIAHDRAGFGGALASNGIAVLLTVLWGIRSGAKWVWWTLFLAAVPGYFGVFMIHMMIGYMNPIHVGPAVIACILTAIGLGLSYRFMCGSSTSKLEANDKGLPPAS